MRVIAGKARRLSLVAPEGNETRPTLDRIKETLFNILQNDVPGSRFLDLFSGSGGIGIEALSRGAKEACFVEYGREPLRCIRANLEKTRLGDQAQILPMRIEQAIPKLDRMNRKFDLVYADPPYQKHLESEIIKLLSGSSVMESGSILILETSLDTTPIYGMEECYEIIQIKKYKTNQHVFLRRR